MLLWTIHLDQTIPQDLYYIPQMWEIHKGTVHLTTEPQICLHILLLLYTVNTAYLFKILLGGVQTDQIIPHYLHLHPTVVGNLYSNCIADSIAKKFAYKYIPMQLCTYIATWLIPLIFHQLFKILLGGVWTICLD